MNKKVLVVSHNCFSKVSNNGKTLESIFAKFSKSDIAQVFFTEDSNSDFDFCNNFYKITDYNVLISLLNPKSKCGIALSPFEKDIIIIEKKDNKFLKFVKTYTTYLSFVRDFLWAFGTWKNTSFINWCKNFKPDVIFFVGGNFGFSHNIACFLSQNLKVPLISYFTDDYLIYPKRRNLLDLIQKRRMKLFYSRTVRQSSLCFAIGDVMAQEYSIYFNKKFLPLMNSIDLQEYQPYLERKDIVISYFGGLHLSRWKMILRLADFLPQALINVYAIQKPSDEILSKFKKSSVNYKGSVQGEDLKREILSSDILLHVESDDEYFRSLTKLSVSTKIPEYLMSGRLVLGFGPEEVASMKILKDNNIGIVIPSSISDDNLHSTLLRITSNFKLRKNIGLQGYKYAIKNFDKQKISTNFKKNIDELIINNGN